MVAFGGVGFSVGRIEAVWVGMFAGGRAASPCELRASGPGAPGCAEAPGRPGGVGRAGVVCVGAIPRVAPRSCGLLAADSGATEPSGRIARVRTFFGSFGFVAIGAIAAGAASG